MIHCPSDENEPITWTYAPIVQGVSYQACRREIVFSIFVFSSSISRICNYISNDVASIRHCVAAHLFRSLLTSVNKIRALNHLLDEISLNGPSVLFTLTNLVIQFHYG